MIPIIYKFIFHVKKRPWRWVIMYIVDFCDPWTTFLKEYVMHILE